MKLLKLETNSCAECKRASAYLDSKGVTYSNVDVSENPDVAAKYSVMKVPVFLLMDQDENEVDRLLGFNQSKLDELINKL